MFLELAKQLPGGWRLVPVNTNRYRGPNRWTCYTKHNGPGAGRYTTIGITKEEAIQKMIDLLKREGVLGNN